VRLARRLMRGCDHAVLATSMHGSPYASLVLVAVDLDASPILLLSDLAQHSRNIAFDPRVSLLIDGTEAYPDRLDGPRLTVLGRAEAVVDQRLLARFTARHPSSALYAGFADFRIYRVVVERGHLVAGFGRIEWVEAAELLFAGDSTALAVAEPAVVSHVNRDHGDTVELFARKLLGREEAGWRVTGLDPEGIDLCCGSQTARIEFAAPALTAEAARSALLQLAESARR
jgi:heme iron utilization protein